MPAALPIIGGVIAAGGAVGSALIASDASKSASQTAADAQQQATNQELQIATQQQQLARDIYGANTVNETPYLNAGYGALAAEQQLLGLKPMTSADFTSGNWYQPGTIDYSKPANIASAAPPALGASNGTGSSGGSTPTSGYTGPSLDQIMAMQHDGISGDYHPALEAYQAYYAAHPSELPQSGGGQTSGVGQAPAPATGGSYNSPAPTDPAAVQQQAQQAIAAGADPLQVHARLATMGVSIQ